MKLYALLMDLLYPPKCPFCGRVLDAPTPGLCQKCAKSLPYTRPEDEQKVDGCDAFLAPLWYRDGVRDGIHRFKFGGGRNHAVLFGRLMVQCLSLRWDGEPDAVTWTPLSKKRLRRRGYDQARLLAEQVASALDIPAPPLLEKYRDTGPQSRLDDEMRRRANVAGAYRLLPGAEERCAGKRLILVDDVVTTGSTMGECARLLKAAGAASVVGLSLARARKAKSQE